MDSSYFFFLIHNTGILGQPDPLPKQEWYVRLVFVIYEMLNIFKESFCIRSPDRARICQ